MAVEALRDVLSSDYRGPRAVFSEVHVLKALLAIGKEGTVGRGRLGSLLGLGQGEVRTLIKRMKEKELLLVGADGCKLSKKGSKEFKRLDQRLPWSSQVQASSLGIGPECSAVLVRNSGGELKKGIEQRDAAVRVGAEGAFTAIFSRGRFTLPGDGQDCEKSGPRELWSAARSASPNDGDVLIVVGAETVGTAELGTLSAALTLL